MNNEDENPVSSPRINPQSSVPVYHQIERALKAQIESGHYGAGDLLPSETEFSQEFKVSKMTVRQALSRLENEGLD